MPAARQHPAYSHSLPIAAASWRLDVTFIQRPAAMPRTLWFACRSAMIRACRRAPHGLRIRLSSPAGELGASAVASKPHGPDT